MNEISAKPVDAPDGPGASAVTDHAFAPRGEWWTRCKHCNLAEAAHMRTSMSPPGSPPSQGDQLSFPEDDNPDEPELPMSGHDTHALDVDLLNVQPKPEPDTRHLLRAAEATGNSCRTCGGIMRRTGACETCESCGENTGCG